MSLMASSRRKGSRARQRLILFLAAFSFLAVAAALVIFALRDNFQFFVTPSQVSERGIAPGQRIRLGGAVEHGSFTRADDGLTLHFSITDGVAGLPVRYKGLLPDLFREGQCVIAEGALDEGGIFTATSVLAKHDENYVPPEVAASMAQSGGGMDCSDFAQPAEEARAS